MNYPLNSISYREDDIMDRLHVLLEHNEQRKALAALHALEGPVLPVFDPGVFAHGRGSVEASPTDVAGVRPFPGVSPHMFFHMAFQFVTVATYGTGVWFLAGVCSHVADHMTPGVCYFTADKAGEHFVGGI